VRSCCAPGRLLRYFRLTDSRSPPVTPRVPARRRTPSRKDTDLTLLFGILLALGCALTTNLGFLYKHRGACAVPAVDFRHPARTARQLFGSRLFSIGMLIAAGSWVLHVGAIALVPLSLVQVVLAGGIVLLAVMAERTLGLRVGRRQWLGLTTCAAGLMLLGLSLPAVHGAHSRFSLPGMVAFEVALVAAGTLLILGPRIGAPSRHHGVMMGAASGILFGVCDVALKALSGIVGAHGLLGLISPWLLVTGAAAVVAFFSSARSLQDGEPIPVIAVTSMAANVSGIVGGIVVFGDPLPGSPVWLAVQSVAFMLVVVAAWLTPAPVRVAAAS
jgi:drug/metabolite transporter (DMT)-like permease